MNKSRETIANQRAWILNAGMQTQTPVDNASTHLKDGAEKQRHGQSTMRWYYPAAEKKSDKGEKGN